MLQGSLLCGFSQCTDLAIRLATRISSETAFHASWKLYCIFLSCYSSNGTLNGSLSFVGHHSLSYTSQMVPYLLKINVKGTGLSHGSPLMFAVTFTSLGAINWGHVVYCMYQSTFSALPGIIGVIFL